MNILRTRRSLLAVVAALSLVAAACGDDDSSSSSDTAPATTQAAATTAAPAATAAPSTAAPETSAAPEPAGPTKVRVTTLGLCNEVPVYWAIDKGIFARNGLEVELVRVTGGSASLAGIIGGSAEFAFTNAFTSILAYTQGFPIHYVATAYNTTEDPLPETNTVIVSADDPATGAADMKGYRIGVNELGGVNQIVTSAWLRQNGIDPTEVNFVALPFPELVPAVIAGRVDAAQVPFTSAAAGGADVKILADPYREGVGKVVFAGYLVTSDFLEENEAAVKNYLKSLDEANAELLATDERFTVAAGYCPTPAEALATQPEQEYLAPVDFDLMNRVAEILVREGQLRELPDISGLIPEWARL